MEVKATLNKHSTLDFHGNFVWERGCYGYNKWSRYKNVLQFCDTVRLARHSQTQTTSAPQIPVELLWSER